MKLIYFWRILLNTNILYGNEYTTKWSNWQSFYIYKTIHIFMFCLNPDYTIFALNKFPFIYSFIQTYN